MDKADGGICTLCLEPPATSVIIRTTADIIEHVAHFRTKSQEFLLCLSLNSRHQLISRRIITVGLVDSVPAHPREIFAGPITDRAASIIIVHNHPSGDPNPSPHDINMTQQIIASGQLLGIPLHEHVILTANGYRSLRGELF